MTGMLLLAIAVVTEPAPLDAAVIPDQAVVYALYGCVALMALFTAAYALGTRAKKHPLRVVRWPR